MKHAKIRRTTPQKIKTIIFDFGNVLVVDTEKAFEEMFDLHRMPKARRDRYEAASHCTERGEKPTLHLLQVMKEEFNLPLSTAELNEIMVSSELIRPMWNLLQQLRKNYQVAILSNNQKDWPKETAKRLGIDLKGIPFFNSAVIGSRKPLKEPYEFALKKLKANAAETLFIDDKKANVQTASKLGIHGILFSGNIQDLMLKLKKSGVVATMNGLDK